MHSIRAQARRAAFDPDDSYDGFNPFARLSARRRRPYQDDEERYHASRIDAKVDESPSHVIIHQAADDAAETLGHSEAIETPGTTYESSAADGVSQEDDEHEGQPTEPQEGSDAGKVASSYSHKKWDGNVHLSTGISNASKRRKSGLRVLSWPLTYLIRASEKSNEDYPVGQQLRLIFADSWFHMLLLLIPAGFALYYTRVNPIAVFFVNFTAMIPSIMLLAMAIDDIILRFGETLGGLISMTFSNASQLITSILLLRNRQVTVLQTSLVGAILSNLLLMPGLCFFFGGLRRMEQYFNVTVAQTTSEMLLVAILALLIPTAAEALAGTTHHGVVRQSRGAAVVLLVCYVLFMLFQLKTHADLYREPSVKTPKRENGKKEPGKTLRSIATIGATTAGHGTTVEVSDDDEGEDVPQLPLLTAVLVAAIFTTLLTFNTLFATNSIQGLLERLDISETFLGIVILPILSNDPTTIIVAIKDKQDLAIALTLGKCVQIALLVLPFIVLLAWWMGIDSMTLSFGNFETVIMLASVLIVNYIVDSGKSHWLVGALLVAAYIIVSVSAYYIPNAAVS